MLRNDELPPVGVFSGVLDEETVEWIKQHPRAEYTLGSIGQGSESRVDTDWRNVERAPIDPYLSPVLCGMLNHFVNTFNASHYCYEVSGVDQIEMLRYVRGGKYESHRDTSDYVEFVKRKFTVIVQLTDDREYEGCDLVIPIVDHNMTPEAAQSRRQKGTVIVFPSYLEHFITPLVNGERTSIVAWVTGPGVR